MEKHLDKISSTWIICRFCDLYYAPTLTSLLIHQVYIYCYRGSRVWAGTFSLGWSLIPAWHEVLEKNLKKLIPRYSQLVSSLTSKTASGFLQYSREDHCRWGHFLPNIFFFFRISFTRKVRIQKMSRYPVTSVRIHSHYRTLTTLMQIRNILVVTML